MEATIEQPQQPLALRVMAHFFSVLFHPLFIPAYTVAFLFYFHPTFFAGFSLPDKYKILLSTLLNTVFFPAFSVLLMKGLGFIKSIRLPTQQERIGPYLASMIFYFWTAWVFFKYEPHPDPALASFMTGVFLTSVAGLLANIYFKISMHGMGIGGLIGFFLVIAQTNSMLMTWPLALALLIGGIVCTSRLLLRDHSNRDVYMGLLAGLLCQFAAAFVIL
ncbi:MAG: hypothetical protein U0X40_00360 [Ferruginibacter sp.]